MSAAFYNALLPNIPNSNIRRPHSRPASHLSSTRPQHDSSKSSPIGDIGILQNSSPKAASSVKLHRDGSESESTLITANDDHPCTDSPRHIALICDGNSRWSRRQQQQQQQQQQRLDNRKHTEPSGHAQGASRVISLLKHVNTHHPRTRFVTIYGFSSENWSRSNEEIGDIWRAMQETADDFKEWAQKNHLRIKLLGDLEDERIPLYLRKTLVALEAQSQRKRPREWMAGNNGDGNGDGGEDEPPLTVCIAINYSGRNDIVNASKKVAGMIAKGEIQADHVDGDVIGSLLSTAGVPDPDLVIRTGGEKRISNFLIWNIAYSELYFTDVLWPDFDDHELDLALEWYVGRDRRFGGRYGAEMERDDN